MGEYADMILDGIVDEYTGEYIGEGVGYPRHLGNGNNNPNPCNGVNNWLNKRGIKVENSEIIKRYGSEVLLMPVESKIKTICARIQKDFNAFTKWVFANYIDSTSIK